MANMESIIDLNENIEFTAKLSEAKDYDEVKAIYAAEGVDLDEAITEAPEETELSEEDLDDVAGGISKKQVKDYLKALVKQLKMTGCGKNTAGVLKWGYYYTVLLTAYADLTIGGNMNKHYSDKQIIAAGKALGFSI